MVNKKNVQALIDILNESMYKFNMDCGVALPREKEGGCIGCFAATLWDEVKDDKSGEPGGYSWNNKKLSKVLGISKQQEQLLTYPLKELSYDQSNFRYRDVSRTDALEVLCTLRDTGKVDWSFMEGRT